MKGNIESPGIWNNERTPLERASASPTTIPITSAGYQLY